MIKGQIGQLMNLENINQYCLYQGEAEIYFQLATSNNDLLVIQAEYAMNNSIVFFQTKLTVEELRQKSEFFNMVTKVEDCFFLFKSIFDEKNLYLKGLTSNYLLLHLSFSDYSLEIHLFKINNAQGFSVQEDVPKLFIQFNNTNEQQKGQESTNNINSGGNYNYNNEENIENGNAVKNTSYNQNNDNSMHNNQQYQNNSQEEQNYSGNQNNNYYNQQNNDNQYYNNNNNENNYQEQNYEENNYQQQQQDSNNQAQYNYSQNDYNNYQNNNQNYNQNTQINQNKQSNLNVQIKPKFINQNSVNGQNMNQNIKINVPLGGGVQNQNYGNTNNNMVTKAINNVMNNNNNIQMNVKSGGIGINSKLIGGPPKLNLSLNKPNPVNYGNNIQEQNQYNNNNQNKSNINININKPNINIGNKPKIVYGNVNQNNNNQIKNVNNNFNNNMNTNVNTNVNINMNSNLNKTNNPPKLNIPSVNIKNTNNTNKTSNIINNINNNFPKLNIPKMNIKNVNSINNNNTTNYNSSINTNINPKVNVNANISTNINSNISTGINSNISSNINNNISSNNNNKILLNNPPKLNMPTLNINQNKPPTVNYNNPPPKINLSINDTTSTNTQNKPQISYQDDNYNNNYNNDYNNNYNNNNEYNNNYSNNDYNNYKEKEDYSYYNKEVEKAPNREEILKQKEMELNSYIEQITLLEKENDILKANLKKVRDDNKSLNEKNSLIQNQLSDSSFNMRQLKKKYEKEKGELQEEVLILTTIIGNHELNQELNLCRNNYKKKRKPNAPEPENINTVSTYDVNGINSNYDNNKFISIQRPTKEVNFNFYKTVAPNSFTVYSIDKTFAAYKSLKNEMFLVYGTKNNSMECYDLIKQKLVKSIINAHSSPILNIRHSCIKALQKDLILSSSNQTYNIKIWDTDTWQYSYNIENIYTMGNMLSVCLLFDIYKNETFVFTSCDSDHIKLYNQKGNYVQNLSESPNNKTYFLDIFQDENNQSYYLLSGDLKCVRAYELNTYKLFRTYIDQSSEREHISAYVYNDYGEGKLIDAEFNGIIRIWEFYSGNCSTIININKRIPLISVCVWNQDYLLIGCNDLKIRVINLGNPDNVKIIGGHSTEVCSIAKINHPNLGECILTQGIGEDQINLWISS